MHHGTIGFIVALALGVLLVPCSSTAQPSATVHRIGVLATFDWPPFETFRHGLRDLGYQEGHNLILEPRWSEGQDERFPALAADLVARQVEVIVTWTTPAAKAAQQATRTIPIVMAASGDPIGTGLIASLARPGGNITGLSALNPELEGHRLELLKEVVPSLTRVALLWNPAHPLHQLMVGDTQRAAQALGVQLQLVSVPGDTDFEAAFATMTREGAEGFIVAPHSVFVFHRARIAALAAQHRLPAIYIHKEHVQAGGLMAYGPHYHDLFRRAATYVDKILKGAKPAELPVEQAMRFELVLNRTTAEALGLTLPSSLLFRADEVLQ
jgi:putative tryptophan/tyrosine transport system substrate-binding protein